MATLIQQDFDLFSTCGADVRIPHSFADLCRNLARQEEDARNNNTGHSRNSIAFRVVMIKFIRASYKDASNCALGLKDAKDIADHYYTTKDQPRHIGSTQY